MIHFSLPYSPSAMTRGDAFHARQYPRQAFANLIDPVLNIDWFDMKAPTFPAHPHAGFSAVTYLFADSPNGFHNRDSVGPSQIIRPGGFHWSRASRGIMHEETPLPDGGAARGLQIFVNLPEANQEDAARVFHLAPEAVTTRVGAGWRSRVAVDGVAIGPVADALPSPVRIEEVAIEGGAAFDMNAPAGWGGVVIALDGAVAISGGYSLRTTEAIGFSSEEDASFRIIAANGPARVAIVTGAQLRQPVHAFGPLMLASSQALERARRYVATLSIHELDAAS